VTRSGAPLQFGAFRLDPARRGLWRGDELLSVPPRCVEILAVLAERPFEVVSKEELLSRVWPDVYVEEANLSVNVSGLRRALGAQPDGRPYIQTVHRRGYRFLAQTRSERRAGPPVLAVLPTR
jgi:DNA-binding winged helix-turn-helix (wHTH) protein